MKYCLLKYFNRVYIHVHANIKIVICTCTCTLYMYSQETTMYTMHEKYCMYPHIFTCTCTIYMYMYMSICDQECNNDFSKPQKIYYVHVRQCFIQQGGGGQVGYLPLIFDQIYFNMQ